MTLILSGSDGLSDIDGSASTPAIRGTDANTGIFFPAADTIAFAEGGTEAMRIDSSGNVGIGTSSPLAKLQTNSTDGTIAIFRTTSGANNSRLNIDISDSAATAGFAVSGASTFPALTFANGGSERMRIDSSGNLLVGQTTTVLTGTIQFTYDGSSRQGMCIKNSANSQNGAAIRFIDYTNAYTGGGIYYTSSNSISYATSSDYRLKENIAPMTGALAKVEQLKPVTFNWKQDNSASQGFIAHELQDIIPEAVIGTKDSVDADGKPMYQGVDTSYIVATLTAAIKELKAINDTQAETINALTARVVALESK